MLQAFTEANYENSIIQLFQSMGYQYVYGPDIERDFESPLFEEVLMDQLHMINLKAPLEAIQSALFKIKNFENGELIEKNNLFMEFLQNGIEVSYLEQGEQYSTPVSYTHLRAHET